MLKYNRNIRPDHPYRREDKICNRCGEKMPHYKQKYCSDSCQRKIICKYCKKVINGHYRYSKRVCFDCKMEKIRLYTRERYKIKKSRYTHIL